MTDLSGIVDTQAPAERDAILFTADGASGRAIAYGELRQAIAGVAGGLRHRGLHEGDRVAILAENRPEHFLAFMAVMRAGGVAVPVNQKLKTAGVAHILADAAVSLVLCDRGNEGLVPPGHERISFDDDGPEGFAALENREPIEAVARPPDEVALVMYTSGSTGRPKGVPITHAGYCWTMERFAFLREVIEGERVLLAAPLFHMNAQFHILTALHNAGTAVVMPRFDATAFLRAIETFGIVRVTGVPTMFALAARAAAGGRFDLGSVESVAMGSAPVTEGLIEQLRAMFPNATVSNGYGTTEAGPAVFGPHPRGIETPPLAVGYPMPDVEVRLVDGPGPDEGELRVRNPMLTRGYLNLPSVNASKFADGWYRTGDVMRRDSDGFHYFIGRSDDMFVCGGENVYPGEVEKRLEAHPNMRQAAVVSIPDEIKGALPVAYVVVSPEGSLSPEDVKQHALDNGPAYAHPRFVEIVSDLPLSGVNKVDRKALAEDALARFGGVRAAERARKAGARERRRDDSRSAAMQNAGEQTQDGDTGERRRRGGAGEPAPRPRAGEPAREARDGK